MKKRTKIGIGIAVIAGVAVLGVVAATKSGGDGVSANVQTVARRDLVSVVNASGWIRPHRRVDVQADIMGRIVELNVREGQTVKRGDVLLRIDPTQYEAMVSQSRANVSGAEAREAQARANLLQAERAYERYRKLSEANANLVSRQQLDDAETQVLVQRESLRAASFSVAQAKSSLAEATDRLAKTVIRAPMDGVITRLNVEEGETAIVGTMNNSGSLLLTVADLGVMEAVVKVDETDLPDLHLGDSASLQIDAFPKQTFTGRVTEIGHSAIRSPEQQAQTGGAGGQAIDYEIVVTLDNPPQTLRSDLSVSAEIVTAKRANALSIPIIALTVREEGTTEQLPSENEAAKKAADLMADEEKGADQEGVFVVREGKSVFVPVTVGINGKDYFEVVSGLTDKDSVIAGPYDVVRTLEAGKVIRPTSATPAAKGKAGAK